MLRKIFYSLLLLLIAGTAVAQSGSIKGTITDRDTGEQLAFVNVIAYKDGVQISGVNTGFEGEYVLKPLAPGSYDILYSYVGYGNKRVNGVIVRSDKITFLDSKLAPGIQLEEAEVVVYKTPLIDKDGGAAGGTVSREDISKMPGRSATSIASTVAGVSTAGTDEGEISIRGARSESTFIYIDGIKVRGSSSLPKSAVQEVSVMTGGIPASYGDATGGVINISLRGASAQYGGGVEFITSGFKSGETGVGLDKYAYNLVEGSLTGPLVFRKDEEGKKTEPLVGFFFSGSFLSQLDPRPYYGGTYRIKSGARASLIDNPLRYNISESGETQGTQSNVDFLTDDSFERVPTRLNVGSKSVNVVGKFDINTSETTSLTFGATGAFTNQHNTSYANSLMNWDNNSESQNYDWRVYGKFSQRFIDDSELADETAKASVLKNVYYSVMVDYSKSSRLTQDDTHKKDFFKYGHIGKFDIYTQNHYTATDNFTLTHDGFEDTLVVYTPSEHNQELAAINNQYFGLFDEGPYNTNNPGPYASLLEVQNGNGLRNGDNPNNIYSLWNYAGVQSNGYSERDERQFRVSATGSADIGDHAFQVGFEYEQRKDAGYFINSNFVAGGRGGPRGLWTLGRLLSNSHIREIDEEAFILTNLGSMNVYTYERLIGDGQFQFDYKLREALGLDPNGNDFINIDAIDPEDLSIEMFGADELLNDGNNYVTYYGYDAYGNKVDEKTTLSDFLNDVNELGYSTRPIGSFEPIYTSGYIMDKFSFDDIIFNVGVRVDRYDANQSVLKDPYVVGDAITAGEVSEIGGNSVAHPSNIGDDFVVYTNDAFNATSILGYRDGDVWYNATGAEVADPTLIAASSGNPEPYLVEGSSPDELTEAAFKDYNPAVNVMPRVAFSFPISDEALFFAHYDILTQRPTVRNRFNPIDYKYLNNRNQVINNPNLRPEKTIDYELGFQQVLSKTSSLKISSFYREIRDQIQIRSFNGAYPRNYRSFDNLDFGTVKGLTTTFDLRRTGNVRMVVSYTLQFADGTGSDETSAIALINAGLPNLRTISPVGFDQRHRINVTLDYRYGEGKDYNGPVWFDKPVFSNTGVNFIANLGSGTPYTSSSQAFGITTGIGGSPRTEGRVNGSRMPGVFTLDMNIDKNFTLKFGGKGEGEAKSGTKTANLNIYLWVANVLNTKNIRDVYRFTGTADDDGYLNASQYQDAITSQTSEESFRSYYSKYVDDPRNLGLPRTIRLGIRLDF